MEQEFYRDEFEQLLKDTTEDFKMYPSRKVWHSIYNDLHPDRKWPSFAVCLLLLTTILYVGVTNNNAINNETKRNTNISLNNQKSTTENTFTSSSKNLPATNKKSIVATNAGDVYNNLIEDDANRSLQTASDENVIADISPTVLVTNNTTADNSFGTTENKAKETIVLAENENEVSQNNATAKVVKMSNTNLPAATLSDENNANLVVEESEADVVITTNADEMLTKTDLLQPSITADKNAAKPGLLVSMNEIKKDTREKEWIEDFAFYNKKKASNNLFKGLAVQFYVTPSIGYRVMFKNSEVRDINASSLVTSNVAEGEPLPKPEVNQQSSISMEAGAGIVKDINKKTRFKTGIQFNYTNYVTYAQPLAHPVQTTLVLNNFSTGYSSFRQVSSSYANMPGSNTSKLENKTIQISIPIGFDYQLLSNKKLSWYVGGTIQPSYVSGGNGYLTSADKNYFIQDMSLLRKFNVSTAVESFVSIKTGSGAFINLGPQFRYQLLSTYSKRYIFTEKPYNIGFKIGFTRPL